MSSELDIKFPEINYDGAYAEMYNWLKDNTNSPFYEYTYADIFLFAMALAKRDGIPPKNLEKPNKMPPSAFDGRMRTLMRCIMIDEGKDVYVIRDNTALRHMCEKYANAGIVRLYTEIKNNVAENPGEDILLNLIRPS